MTHSKKYRSYYSLYLSRDDIFSVAICGRGGVGHSTTQFFTQKFYFSADIYDMVFRPLQSHRTASPMASLLSKAYSDSSTGDYSYGVTVSYV